MESTNWSRADLKPHGQLQGTPADLLQSAHEVLARDLALRLSAFLRCSAAAKYTGGEELSFGDLPKNESPSCFGSVLIRPDEHRLLLELNSPFLFLLIGLALGAKAGGFTIPERKPTDIELQIVNILFRLILAEAYVAWAPVAKAQLETVALEIDNALMRAFQPTDSVFVARFELTIGEYVGQLAFIVPPALFASAAAVDEPIQKSEISGSSEATLQLMLPARVSVDVWLEGAHMRLRDLLQLCEGQVVKLDHPVERKAACTLNGKAGFTGQIVSTGAHRAFMVEEGSLAGS